MMDPVNNPMGSPYISDLDYSTAPQSPNPSNAHLNSFGSPNPSPYDSFEFPQNQRQQASSPFPHTPSYNGSYQNSPFIGSAQLPLDPNDVDGRINHYNNDYNNDNSNTGGLGIFDSMNGGDFQDEVGITIEEPDSSQYGVYNPVDYDAPNGGNGSANNSPLMFDHDSPNHSDYDLDMGDLAGFVAVTPPMDDSPHSFDHASPASSYGSGDANRSRASSVASNHPRPPQSHTPLPEFHNLSFTSPSPAPFTIGLPPVSPPPNKPQSPPQLLIPDTSPTSPYMSNGMPTINAPDGDGGGLGVGPQLHIVPATPVSGGGAASNPTEQVGFQRTLEGLQQNGAADGQRPTWTAQGHQPQHPNDPGNEPSSSQQPPGSSSSPSAALSVPSYHNANTASSNAGTNSVGGGDDFSTTPFAFPGLGGQPQRRVVGAVPSSLGALNLDVHNLTSNNNYFDDSSSFLVPQSPSRGRSKSDTSLRPNSLWAIPPRGFNANNESAIDVEFDQSEEVRRQPGQGTVNMNDVSPQGSPNAGQTSFPNYAQTAPPQQYDFGPSVHQHQLPSSNDFLSPDLALGAGSIPLRRSASDSGRRGHTRMARSEDLGGRGRLYGGVDIGVMGGYPPSSHQEFISQATRSGPGTPAPGNGFLHPNSNLLHAAAMRSLGGPVPNAGLMGMQSVGLGPGAGTRVGGRAERGIGAAAAAVLPGHHRRASSGSRSPYPSPSGSPRMLPGSLGGGGYDAYDSSGEMGGGVMGVSGLARGAIRKAPSVAPPPQEDPADMASINKQNVTTHATRDASERRRKTDANFVCPVPGCGSTFTRGFNLKGHLRSHTDDRPFACKWPGCSKSFARQHDCKRHEQLHLGVREFKCAGCQKEFARMDALNRHLRSEGGAECQKIHQEAQEEKARSKGTAAVSTFPKPEPGEGGWGMGGLMM